MSLARNTFVQTALTLGSRILGFARDLAANYRFGGQGPYMDAFATALMFPNLFRRLFAEGAFSQAFVPVYAKERAEHGDEIADEVASDALSFLVFSVALFCVAAEVALPWLMPFLLSAYAHDNDTLRVATLMTQLTMPYLACMTIAAHLSGVLNTQGRFALSAGVPILLNLCTLGPLILSPDRHVAAYTTAIAVTVAGVFQVALLWWGAGRQGIKMHMGIPRLTPKVRKVVGLAVPGALAGGALQINTLTSQFLTGSDAGARAVLYNADRLYQLPLGLIGVAVGLALVPRLSRLFFADDAQGASDTMDQGITLSMAFTLPAALAFLVMPYFIIDATVTRGAFTHADAHRTADVLRQFAWGVPAFVLAKVLTPPFFARHDTRRPMQYSMISVAVNTILGIALFFGLPRVGVDGTVGLAIATSVAGWTNVILLSSTLARENVYRLGGAALSRLLRLALACGVMGAFIGVCAFQYPFLAKALLHKEIAVLVVAAVGFLLFIGAAFAFRAVTPREIADSLRRERAPEGVPTGGEIGG